MQQAAQHMLASTLPWNLHQRFPAKPMQCMMALTGCTGHNASFAKLQPAGAIAVR